MGLAGQTAFGTITNDRLYLLGDHPDEGATAGTEVGSSAASEGFTFDSVIDNPPDLTDSQDLLSDGASTPQFVDVGPTGLNRPGADAGSLGVEFNGVDQRLSSISFNSPNETAQNIEGYPRNYEGIFGRGYQGWVMPDSAKQDVRQDVIADHTQHGIFISDTNTWGLSYGGAQITSETAVDFDAWSHVMHIATGNQAILYVDGVAVAATNRFYNGGVSFFAIGADASENGGTNNYQGVVDDLSVFVFGDNTSNGGQDWGTPSLVEDNGFIADALGDVLAGDVDLDGNLDDDDVTAFVSFWGSENRVNGALVGDLNTRNSGDLNLDGRVDLGDWNVLVESFLAEGQAAPVFSIPEPSSLALVGLAGLALVKRRRA